MIAVCSLLNFTLGYGYEGGPHDGPHDDRGYNDYSGDRRYKRDRTPGSDRHSSPDRKRTRRDDSERRGVSREVCPLIQSVSWLLERTVSPDYLV